MARYLDWLDPLFEEAQVSRAPEHDAWLDRSLRSIAGLPDATEEQVYRKLRARWLDHGRPGWQLLAGLLRDEVYSRRDSPMRPKEGSGYFTNEWRPKGD